MGTPTIVGVEVGVGVRVKVAVGVDEDWTVWLAVGVEVAVGSAVEGIDVGVARPGLVATGCV